MLLDLCAFDQIFSYRGTSVWGVGCQTGYCQYHTSFGNAWIKLVKDIWHYPTSSYAYVGNKNWVEDTVGPLLNAEGNKEANHEEVCNLLNEYFSSVSEMKKL